MNLQKQLYFRLLDLQVVIAIVAFAYSSGSVLAQEVKNDINFGTNIVTEISSYLFTESGIQENIEFIRNEIFAHFDEVVASIDEKIKVVGTDGQLYLDVDWAIKLAEAKQKVWEIKSNDPGISSKTKETCADLARCFESHLTSLYDRKILLAKVRDELEGKRKELIESKELVIDLIYAGEMGEAIKEFNISLDTILKTAPIKKVSFNSVFDA